MTVGNRTVGRLTVEPCDCGQPGNRIGRLDKKSCREMSFGNIQYIENCSAMSRLVEIA